MSELAFEVLNVVVKLFVVACVTYVLPPIKNLINKILSEKWAKDTVNAAQQLMAQKTGEERKEFVMQELMQALNSAKINITEEQLNILIESAVKQLRIEEGKRP